MLSATYWNLLNRSKGDRDCRRAGIFHEKTRAKGTSFETIVASGVRSALPHGVASEKVIEHGDVVTMDFGAVFKGYCSI